MYKNIDYMQTMRKIEVSDYHKKYELLFSTLSSCTLHSSEQEFSEIIVARSVQGWQTWVLEDEIIDKNKNKQPIIIATISLMLERKIYREGRFVGHIEDVIVLPEYQHHKLGMRLVDFAVEEAQRQKCYKIILDCKPELENFYTKSGLTIANVQMAKYF